MAYRHIDVRTCTPTVGAEIRGVDLREPLPDEAFEEVRAAFLRHQVVFFKEQETLAPDRQIAFARRFGGLHLHPAAPHLEGLPEVFVIHTHRDSKIANGNGWHTDVSCDAEPPLGTMLQLHRLPSQGGDTLFASMYGGVGRIVGADAGVPRDAERPPRVRTCLPGPLFGPGCGRHRQGLSGIRASRRPHPSGDRTPRALCQPRLHHAHRRPRRGGKQGAAQFPLRAYRAGALPGPLRVGGQRCGLLGTTAASSTTPCGTTGPRSARATG